MAQLAPPTPSSEILHVVETYADTLDALPPTLTRSLSDIKELDAVLSGSLQGITAKLERLLLLLRTEKHEDGRKVTPLERLLLLREVTEDARAFRLGGEDKIRVATGTCESISTFEHHLSTLSTLLLSYLPGHLIPSLPPPTAPHGYPGASSASSSSYRRQTYDYPAHHQGSSSRLHGALAMVREYRDAARGIVNPAGRAPPPMATSMPPSAYQPPPPVQVPKRKPAAAYDHHHHSNHGASGSGAQGAGAREKDPSQKHPNQYTKRKQMAAAAAAAAANGAGGYDPNTYDSASGGAGAGKGRGVSARDAGGVAKTAGNAAYVAGYDSSTFGGGSGGNNAASNGQQTRPPKRRVDEIAAGNKRRKKAESSPEPSTTGRVLKAPSRRPSVQAKTGSHSPAPSGAAGVGGGASPHISGGAYEPAAGGAPAQAYGDEAGQGMGLVPGQGAYDDGEPTDGPGEEGEEGDGQKYCYCQRGSYGEMIGCDGSDCEREWFHLACVGLKAIPKGSWFCDECRSKGTDKSKKARR